MNDPSQDKAPPDRVSLSVSQTLGTPSDPNAETDVIPADQFVLPGQQEFPPTPDPQGRPHGVHPVGPHRRTRGYNSAIRTLTLVAIFLVLALAIWAILHFLQT